MHRGSEFLVWGSREHINRVGKLERCKTGCCSGVVGNKKMEGHRAGIPGLGRQ